MTMVTVLAEWVHPKMTSGYLRSNFHDSGLLAFELGPRRELSLTISLDPVWNPGKGSVVVRLGSIENFEEVRRFFTQLTPPPSADGFIDSIMAMTCHGKPGSLTCILELEDWGRISLTCRNASEVDA